MNPDVRKILDPLADQYITCARVLEYIDGERPPYTVKSGDWIRVLEASEGELVLDASGSNLGRNQYGYTPERETLPFDVWTYSAINEDLGDQPAEWTETRSKREMKRTFEHFASDVIHYSESEFVEGEGEDEGDDEGDDAASVAMTDGGVRLASDGGIRCPSCGDSVDPMHMYRCPTCGKDLVGDGEGSR